MNHRLLLKLLVMPHQSVCRAIQSIAFEGRRTYSDYSLKDSTRCGCQYCSAICEFRPKLANSDNVDVELLRNSLLVFYHGTHGDRIKVPHYLGKEFFTLDSKPANAGSDPFSNDSVAQDDPVIPTAREITGNTGSTQSFEIIRGWLSTCMATHESLCSMPDLTEGCSRLPDRVIKVSLSTPRRVCLINTENRRERYACLSHCWGGQYPLQTTRNPDTLSAHLKTIEEQSLPKTFQDAITVIVELGIQFIWIDSLCV